MLTATFRVPRPKFEPEPLKKYAPPPTTPEVPIYKKGWFWGAIGVGALGIIGIVLAKKRRG